MRCIVRTKFFFFLGGTLSFLTNIDFEKYSQKLILVCSLHIGFLFRMFFRFIFGCIAYLTGSMYNAN